MTSSESKTLAFGTPTFLDMPDVVMNRILENLCYMEFQILRRTCHSLLDKITNFKPDPKFKSIFINIQSGEFQTNSIILTLHFHQNHPSVDLNYIIDQRGSWMEKKYHNSSKKMVKFLENQNFRDVFYRDFTGFLDFLNFPKAVVEVLTLNIGGQDDYEFLEKIEKIRNLKIQSLILNVRSSEDVAKFLKATSSQFLRKLKIGNSESKELKIEEFEDLEQWKSLEEIEIRGFFVRDPRKILDFSNFSKVEVEVQKLTADMVRDLKETFRSSISYKSCKLNYIYMHQNQESIFGALGVSPDQEVARRRWFWKTSDPEKLLLIEYNRTCILFETIGLEDFPENAVVIE